MLLEMRIKPPAVLLSTGTAWACCVLRLAFPFPVVVLGCLVSALSFPCHLCSMLTLVSILAVPAACTGFLCVPMVYQSINQLGGHPHWLFDGN